MKKKYMKPTLQVVSFGACRLMAASGPEAEYGGGNGGGGGSVEVEDGGDSDAKLGHIDLWED